MPSGFVDSILPDLPKKSLGKCGNNRSMKIFGEGVTTHLVLSDFFLSFEQRTLDHHYRRANPL